MAVNRVLLLLLVAACASAATMSFLTVAPNRLVSGTGVYLGQLLLGGRRLLLVPAAALLIVALMRPTRSSRAAAALAATLVLAGLLWIAGDEAQHLAEHQSGAARVSLGASFWILASLAWLAAMDALQGLEIGSARRALACAAILLPALGLLLSGQLDQLALLKEYANRRDVFHAAWLRHAEIVLATLLPSLVIGVPLGIAAARKQRFASALFAVLDIIQTVPSIAMFGLLIVSLGWLGGAFPGWGIHGVGLLPAVIALVLYALLPIVHGATAGLRQVPGSVVEAALGMGMTQRALFWQIEAPLALPVLLSSLRVTAVQVVGLAVVAALIGAGGFGAIVFQGLASGALDLVMLGVLPVIVLGVGVDAGFRLLAMALEDRRR